MIQCICAVQEGQISTRQEAALRAGLEDLAQGHFNAPASISWMAVPKGSGFTAGAPSTASVVAMTAPAAMRQSVRENLLTEICNLWVRETGCTLNEIVATVSDPQP